MKKNEKAKVEEEAQPVQFVLLEQRHDDVVSRLKHSLLNPHRPKQVQVFHILLCFIPPHTKLYGRLYQESRSSRNERYVKKTFQTVLSSICSSAKGCSVSCIPFDPTLRKSSVSSMLICTKGSVTLTIYRRSKPTLEDICLTFH